MSKSPLPNLHFRQAQITDVPAIRQLLADDALGKTREDLSGQGLENYLEAFSAIQDDPRNELWLALLDDQIVGTWQITWIPYLSRGGNERCHIEAVRTASKYRGQGIGRQMMQFTLDRARTRGCLLAQLTTDKSRPDAHRFYIGMGFKPSHEGMKYEL